MTYFTGSVGTVPDENRQAFLDHVAAVWRVLKTYGAKRMIETWGVDVPKGKVTDFYGAVDAKEGETIVFSWIEWPDRETANACWEKMADDPAMKDIPEMPFDGRRMIIGGFEPVFTEGKPHARPFTRGLCWRFRKRARRHTCRLPVRAGRYSRSMAPLEWSKPAVGTCRMASRLISTVRQRPKKERSRISAGRHGRVAKPAMPPGRQWKRDGRHGHVRNAV